MFGRTPEINLKSKHADAKDIAFAQDILNDMLEKSRFKSKLIQAAKDCFIGKRVAIKISGGFGREPKISFRPSFEFVYSELPVDRGKAHICHLIDVHQLFQRHFSQLDRSDLPIG